LAKEISPLDFYCPDCGKRASVCVASLFKSYSIKRLDIPYYVCDSCQIWSFDKRIIRNIVRDWHKDKLSFLGVRQTFEEIYKEVTDFLKNIINDKIKNLGHRTKRFRHNPQPQKKERKR